jgi:hypothetical protein
MKLGISEKWVGGLAEWLEEDTVFLSIAFTWKIDEAVEVAARYKFLGKRVIAGGPALFLPEMKKLIEPVAEIGTDLPDAVYRHHPLATIASRGCPVGCSFCIVPAMDGKEFTFLPDFPVRPILCDNNLSALPIEYQKHIIARYESAAVPLLDANSGFEPATFSDEIYQLWKSINRGPWRFAFDETIEGEDVLRVMAMLKAEPERMKRVYVLIGNEPYEPCLRRIQEVIEGGCTPHVQPLMKLNALTKTPWVRFDWTEQRLRDVARWANGFLWRSMPFSEYDRSAKKAKIVVTSQQELFI